MSPRSRHALIAAVAALVVVGAVVAALALRGTTPADGPTTSPSATAAPSPTDVASTPAAPTSAAAAPSPTAVPEPTQEPSAAPADERGTVDVQLAFAEWNTATRALEASGYAQTYESDGTCTLTAASGTRSASVTQGALADVSTTTCGMLAIPADRLGPGSWQVRVDYASSTSTGSSQTLTVEVP